MDAPKTGEFAHIGKSVVVKGELSGSEDLYVDGNVEGSIELRNHSLIVGPNGTIKATVTASRAGRQSESSAIPGSSGELERAIQRQLFRGDAPHGAGGRFSIPSR